jgi:putative oxidoreductase
MTVARLTLGIFILPHGAMKLLGWWGGPGFAGTMQNMTGHLGIPAFFVLLAIVAEFFGGLGLISGLLTRVAAFGVGVTMLVAAVLVHLPEGFMGIQLQLLAVGLAIAIMIRGAGALSVDRWIAERAASKGSAEAPAATRGRVADRGIGDPVSS